MKIEECCIGMKVVINHEADGFYTTRYRGSLATIECIYNEDVNIYCEDKRIKEGGELYDGLIKGVRPDYIDRVADDDLIECDVDVILI